MTWAGLTPTLNQLAVSSARRECRSSVEMRIQRPFYLPLVMESRWGAADSHYYFDAWTHHASSAKGAHYFLLKTDSDVNDIRSYQQTPICDLNGDASCPWRNKAPDYGRHYDRETRRFEVKAPTEASLLWGETLLGGLRSWPIESTDCDGEEFSLLVRGHHEDNIYDRPAYCARRYPKTAKLCEQMATLHSPDRYGKRINHFTRPFGEPTKISRLSPESLEMETPLTYLPNAQRRKDEPLGLRIGYRLQSTTAAKVHGSWISARCHEYRHSACSRFVDKQMCERTDKTIQSVYEMPATLETFRSDSLQFFTKEAKSVAQGTWAPQAEALQFELRTQSGPAVLIDYRTNESKECVVCPELPADFAMRCEDSPESTKPEWLKRQN